MSFIQSSSYKLIAIIAFMLLLSSCGQKGALIRPENSKQRTSNEVNKTSNEDPKKDTSP